MRQAPVQRSALEQWKIDADLFLFRLSSQAEIDRFLEYFTVLLSAGMDVSRAIEAVTEDVHSEYMKKTLAQVAGWIESGYSISQALKKSGIFSESTIALLKIGEDSGTLKQSLTIIALQRKKEREFRSKIRSAAMYPVFVLTLALIIGICIAWFILPQLSKVFTQLRLKLPLITRILLGVGDFLAVWGKIAVPVALLAVLVGFYVLFVQKRTKFVGQNILLHIPGVGNLIKQIEISRFGYFLGMLLNSGIPIGFALAALRDLSSFVKYRTFYEYLDRTIAQGQSFQYAFQKYPGMKHLFPFSFQQLVSVGEQSGTLSSILLQVHTDYESKIESSTKDLTVILEPILLIIVWLGVLAVALAVILPIYSLVGQVSNI